MDYEMRRHSSPSHQTSGRWGAPLVDTPLRVHGRNESVENADDVDGLLDSLRAKITDQSGSGFESDYSHTGRALDVVEHIAPRLEFD